MPMDRSRYPENWDAIATQVKTEAGWTCERCKLKCIAPGDTKPDTRRKQAQQTLTVHHKNFLPEDNRRCNLIALCSRCHLWHHRRQRRNLPPGQLFLFQT
jgi:predicted HNH restriction endonuclease